MVRIENHSGPKSHKKAELRSAEVGWPGHKKRVELSKVKLSLLAETGGRVIQNN